MHNWLKASALAVVLGSLFAGGCASTSETAGGDTMTAHVGKYDPPPSGIATPRVGVPPFVVESDQTFKGNSNPGVLAADQMTTLLDQTDRFKVIERAQMDKLIKEQNLEGIVKPGELAKPAQIRGVDYLLIGKVTNLRVKLDKTQHGFGLAQVGGIINLGGLDIKKKETKIQTDCGVDIRLVNPTTGELFVSNFSEYHRVDTAGAMGVAILGANAEADAAISVSEDDKGKILRLALDDALRKCLPKIDRKLKDLGASEAPAPSSATPSAGATAIPTAAPADAAKGHFCTHCGKPVVADAKFCTSCGKQQ